MVAQFRWGEAVSKTSRSIFDALRLTLRAQPRSGNFKFGHYQSDSWWPNLGARLLTSPKNFHAGCNSF